MQLSQIQKNLIDFIDQTNLPVFLTGKAGTGKTTFLKYIKSNIKKNLAIVAPTAVAAINAEGVTINSFFQVPFGPHPPQSLEDIFGKIESREVSVEKAKILKCLDLLIIDEISMVRADTIDYIDAVLKKTRSSSQLFGGVQVLMIGDLYQLPPVFQNDWHILKSFYKGPYFFDSIALSNQSISTFELTEVYRQKEYEFVGILNGIRNSTISDSQLAKLNERFDPAVQPIVLNNHVTLTTHNDLVAEINNDRLEALNSPSISYYAKIHGDFPKESYPVDERLILKIGAMVMFVKNDSSGNKAYYNGKTALITALAENQIKVRFLDDDSEFDVVLETWQNVKYTLVTGDQKVSEDTAGSFTQFPLRLAWAITIHKSQGLTFDNAIVDISSAFSHGQAYVALSRCRSMKGLVLKEKVRKENIITDTRIEAFIQSSNFQQEEHKSHLKFFKNKTEIHLLTDIFEYANLVILWKKLKIELFSQHKDSFDTGNWMVAIEDKIVNDIEKISRIFINSELSSEALSSYESSYDHLKPRLEKASNYFLQQLITLKDELEKNTKAFHKTLPSSSYFKCMDQINCLIQSKISALEIVGINGTLLEICESLKKTLISYQPLNMWQVINEPIEKEIKNKPIYDKLVIWRQGVAENIGKPDYTIISEKTLRDIAATQPRSFKDLANIKNLGEGKASAYGAQILKILAQFTGETELF